MRKLPEEIAKVVVQLHELRTSNSFLGQRLREQSILALLYKLEAANAPGTLPCIAKFLVSPTQIVRKTAVEVIGKLIRNVDPYELIRLSDSVCWSYEWVIDDKWERLKPSDVVGLAGSPSEAGYSGVLGILSFHRSGHVRQEAIRCLSRITDGSELPFLIIRQNDWVQPIAKEAQQAVGQRISGSNLPHFVRCMRLTLHLESLKRYDHGNAIRRMISILCMPEHQDLLHSAIASSDRKVRHQIIRHVFDQPGEHQLRTLVSAVNSTDPSVRASCCRHLNIIGDSELFSAIQAKLVREPFMPIRREALEQKVKRFPEQFEQIWTNALYDSSRSIRELARFMLRKIDIDQTKMVAMYRLAISIQPELFAALEGLAEVGDLSDTLIFRERLSHRLPTRRAAAIRGLSRILKEDAIAELLPYLNDESPCVVRAVRKAIGPFAYLIDPGKLESLAVAAISFYSRKNAVDLIFALGKWQSIPWLLRVAANADPATAQYAERKLLRWFEPPECNRVFTRPTDQNKADINECIRTSDGKVSGKTLSLIQREVESKYQGAITT